MFWTVGGHLRTWRKPTLTWGEHMKHNTDSVLYEAPYRQISLHNSKTFTKKKRSAFQMQISLKMDKSKY